MQLHARIRHNEDILGMIEVAALPRVDELIRLKGRRYIVVQILYNYDLNHTHQIAEVYVE